MGRPFVSIPWGRVSSQAPSSRYRRCCLPVKSMVRSRQLCFGRGEATSSRHDRLLLGEEIAKDILSPLAELEALVRIQDHGLHECLGLLTTRFPNSFDGQA